MNEELKITIKANIDDAKKGLQDVQKELDNSGKSGEKFKKVLDGMGSVAKTAGKAIGVSMAAVGASLTALGASMAKNISQVAELGDNIDKQSQKLGMSAESYQEWDFILQHCGSSVDSLQGTMKSLQKAANSNSESFAALGISQKEVASLNKEELFNKTIEGLQGISDEGQRAKLATELLGRGAAELAPLLNTSAEETAEMRKEVHELGGVLSDEAVEDAAFFQDSLQNLKTTLGGTKNELFSNFLWPIGEVMRGLTQLFQGDDGGLNAISGGIEIFTDRLSLALPRVLEAGTAIMNSLLSAITANLPELLKAGVQVVTQLAKGITKNLKPIIQAIFIVSQQILAELPNLISAIIEELPNLMQALIQGVIDLIPVLIQGILSAIPIIIDGLVNLIMMVVENFEAIINPIINALPDIITTIVSALLKNLPTLIRGAIQLAVGIVGATGQIIKVLVPMIPEIIEQIVVALISCIPELIKGVIDICGAVWNFIVDFLAAIVDYIVNAFISSVKFLVKLPQLFNDTVLKPFPEYVQKIFDNIKKILDNIISSVSNTFNKAASAIKTVFSGLKNFFSDFWNNIKKMFSAVGQAVGGAITNTVKTAINGILSTATKIINGFIKAINTAISVINAIPGVKISKIKELSVPKLATGGIATRSTLANIGEAGKEAVLPLERNTEWMDILADRINGKQASPTKIVLMLGEKQLGEACIDSINSITRTTGTLPLTIV